jgi:hypothetical protein
MYLCSTKEEATHVLMRANSGCGPRISHKALGLDNCSVFRNANPSVGEEGLLYGSELRLTLTSLSLEADTKVNNYSQEIVTNFSRGSNRYLPQHHILANPSVP